MPTARITLTLDEELLRAVRIRAAHTGKRSSEVIEESLRRDFALDELERIWARVKPAPEEDGLALAYAELKAMRREKRAAN
jgi:gamma-glutamyl:cysteine ligase YbdK (ATP-grasp superfamily)